jgi:hypothetical protein
MITDEMIEAGASRIAWAIERDLFVVDSLGPNIGHLRLAAREIFLVMKAKEPKSDPTQLQQAMEAAERE